MRESKRSTKVLPLFGIILLIALAITSTVFAISHSVTDSTPGYADGNQIARSVTINDPGVVMDVNVAVDFHKIPTENCSVPYRDGQSWSWSTEMSMALRSPAGTRVNLVYDDAEGPTYTNSGATAQRVAVTFDDEAAQQVGGEAPVAGVFRPEEPLSAFDGEPASGEWVLILGDTSSWDYLCYYSFTLDVTTDTTPEPTITLTPEPTITLTPEPTITFTPEPTITLTPEPTETSIETATPLPDVTLADGSLNPRHLGRPVAIYAADDGGYTVYGIDVNTGWGTLALTITPQMIAEAGVPTGDPVIIAEGQNPYNYRPFTLYRLPSGEFQLNTYYWDGKPYNVKWSAGDSHVTTVNW